MLVFREAASLRVASARELCRYSYRNSKSPASTCVPGRTSTSAIRPVVLGVDRRLHLHRFQRQQLLPLADLLARRHRHASPPDPGIGAADVLGIARRRPWDGP